MKERGLEVVAAAKADGRWDRAYSSARTAQMPADLTAALDEHPKAKKRYFALSKLARYDILRGLETVKKADTRNRRIAAFIGRPSLLIHNMILHSDSRARCNSQQSKPHTALTVSHSGTLVGLCKREHRHGMGRYSRLTTSFAESHRYIFCVFTDQERLHLLDDVGYVRAGVMCLVSCLARPRIDDIEPACFVPVLKDVVGQVAFLLSGRVNKLKKQRFHFARVSRLGVEFTKDVSFLLPGFGHFYSPFFPAYTSVKPPSTTRSIPRM